MAALFAVNTGARRGVVTDLEWSWHTEIPDSHIYVFVIPPGYHGAEREKVLFLNSIARKVIQHQRGRHSKYVFPSKRGGQVSSLGKVWLTSWRKAGLPDGEGYSKGVENLRLTFESRLKKANVAKEDRDLLLWTSDALRIQGDRPLDYEHLQLQVEKIVEPSDEGEFDEVVSALQRPEANE